MSINFEYYCSYYNGFPDQLDKPAKAGPDLIDLAQKIIEAVSKCLSRIKQALSEQGGGKQTVFEICGEDSLDLQGSSMTDYIAQDLLGAFSIRVDDQAVFEEDPDHLCFTPADLSQFSIGGDEEESVVGETTPSLLSEEDFLAQNEIVSNDGEERSDCESFSFTPANISHFSLFDDEGEEEMILASVIREMGIAEKGNAQIARQFSENLVREVEDLLKSDRSSEELYRPPALTARDLAQIEEMVS